MEKEKLLLITKENLEGKKLKLVHKEAILSKLRYSCSGRQNSIHKFQAIIIGCLVTLATSFLIFFLQGGRIKELLDPKILSGFILGFIIIILIIFFRKLKLAEEYKNKFGNQIEEVQKSIREELKEIVKHGLIKTGNNYSLTYPIKY